MFFSPWYFLCLLALPLVAYRLFAKNHQNSLGFTSVSVAQKIRPTLRQRLLWLPKVLSLLSIAVLIFGLARPRQGQEKTIVDSQGIAIEMVVDRSGSMQALDFKIDGNNVDRLTAIKNVAKKFVQGADSTEGLDGRYSDLVGLITFARYADGVAPPTLDHQFLVANLNKISIVKSSSEDGTAIGDAIALGLEKLNALDEQQSEKLKSKVIILLTDGENTAGELEPKAAAEIAQTLGIKIYTIGVGTKGQAPFPSRNVFGQIKNRMMKVNIDEATLKSVAKITGGKYFRATDTDSLLNIYKEIDELEKSKVESQNYVDYSELAVQPYRAGSVTIPALLLIAFALLIGRVILENTWLRETL